jgi:steroid delta-isomerase-like uncharacterized protein
MSAENKVLIRRWFEEVWNRGRAAAIDEMLTGQAQIHGLGPQPMNVNAFKQFHTQYRSAFPDVRIQVDDVIAEGDKVAVRWSGTGTHQGDSLGFAASGNAVRFTGMTIARIENGKLVEGWNVFDRLGMLQQCGVVNLPAAS